MATPAGTLAVEIVERVLSISAFLAVGLGVASLALQFGAVQYITRLAGPLTRAANLPSQVGTAILATTVSSTAGYGMLAEYRESGLLSDRATLVAVTINTFFGYVQHLFIFYGPVMIPILGAEVGLFYVGVRGLVALAITLTGILAGAVILAEGTDVNPDATVAADGAPAAAQSDRAETTRGKLAAAGRETVDRLRDILPRLLGIYAVVIVLVDRWSAVDAVLGLPDVSAVLGPLTAAVGLPEAAVPALAVFAVDTTSGAIFIAPFVENGTFTPRQAVATMLVGGIVSFAVTTFKRSIPFQYGIWGPEFGTKVIAVNTGLKVCFIACAVAALLVPP
jgi:hypothetical protein